MSSGGRGARGPAFRPQALPISGMIRRKKASILGEIIYSICIGGFLAASGVAMIVILSREEKKLGLREEKHKKNG